MKPHEINNLVHSILVEEIKSAILKGNNQEKSVVFHIKHNGEPVDTFLDEASAQQGLNIYKNEHPDKQFIIEKCAYESHSDMIDRLDEMGEQIEQNESSDMKKSPIKVKTIHEAIVYAKENGIKKVRINEDVYDVDECWNEMQESEEEDCTECEDEMTEEDKKKSETEKKEKKDEEKKEPKKGVDLGKSFDKFKKDVKEGDVCEKCGKEECECTMKESKVKSVRITEAQLIDVISNIVKESGVPGLSVTKKAQSGSKKINDENATNVGKKIKDYLSFDGNDNPEFPKPIGKGEKVAINNTKEEDEFVDDNRGRGMENLVYDHEPSKQFKDRAKASLEGDSKMGNSTKSLKVDKSKISNGADPKDPEEDNKDAIETETGKKINKAIPRKQKIKKDEPLYPKEKVPVKEERIKFFSLLEEQLNSMSKNKGQ
jgi:hypothetical protein